MPTYCSAADVGKWLQKTFSGTSHPSTTEVEELIEMNEDKIDQATGHAWRQKTITEEFHHLRLVPTRWDGIPIFLRHRDIQSIDKLEIWNGSSYDDWKLVRTEGRSSDWWAQYSDGIIWLRLFIGFTRPNFAVRTTYKFGASSVPKDIKKAAMLMTAADILYGDDRSILLASGEATNIPFQPRIEAWMKEVDTIIDRRKEFSSASY